MLVLTSSQQLVTTNDVPASQASIVALTNKIRAKLPIFSFGNVDDIATIAAEAFCGRTHSKPVKFSINQTNYKVHLLPKENGSTEIWIYLKKSNTASQATEPNAVVAPTSKRQKMTRTSAQPEDAADPEVSTPATRVKLGMIKTNCMAARIVVSNDSQVQAEEGYRLTLDLAPRPHFPHPKKDFDHEVHVLESVKGIPEFTQLYASAVYDGSKGGNPRPKGVMFQKFYPGGEFFHHHNKITMLPRRDKEIEFREQYSLYKGLLVALKALKDNKIIHNDIKPENLLLDEDLKVIVADLENSVTPEIRSDVEFCLKQFGKGSPEYLSPERFHSIFVSKNFDSIDEKSNMWSIGLLLYILHYRDTHEFHIMLHNFFQVRAFPDMTAEMQKQRISKQKEIGAQIQEYIAKNSQVNFPPKEDLSFDDLLERILHVDPAKRISVDDALAALEKLEPSKNTSTSSSSSQ